MALFYITFVLTLLQGFFLNAWLPWWSPVVIAFVLGVVRGKKNVQAFFGGFAAVALAWLLIAGLQHFRNEGLLTGKIAEVLKLPGSWLLFVAVGLIGGLLGGLGGLTGFKLRLALGGSSGTSSRR